EKRDHGDPAERHLLPEKHLPRSRNPKKSSQPRPALHRPGRHRPPVSEHGFRNHEPGKPAGRTPGYAEDPRDLDPVRHHNAVTEHDDHGSNTESLIPQRQPDPDPVQPHVPKHLERTGPETRTPPQRPADLHVLRKSSGDPRPAV